MAAFESHGEGHGEDDGADLAVDVHGANVEADHLRNREED